MKLKSSGVLEKDARKSAARFKNGGKVFSEQKSKNAGVAVKKMLSGMNKKGK